MAFDPTNYKPTANKVLPVVLLLDVSGSMSGDKINKLYDATVDMLDSFVKQQIKETIIHVSIITFGASIDLHTPFTPVEDLYDKGIKKFVASGCTPLGTALRMTKDMLEDKGTLPRLRYVPAVVLVSDGHPTDDWKGPFTNFLNSGISGRCQRFSIGIGNDLDTDMLRKFADSKDTLFFAENAADIAECFEKVTQTVSVRSKSVNPNDVQTKSKPSTDNKVEESIKSRSIPVNIYTEEDEDDDDFI